MNGLVKYRKKHGLSQKLLADTIGVDQASVSMWERGTVIPGGPARILLSALIRLDCPPNELSFCDLSGRWLACLATEDQNAQN